MMHKKFLLTIMAVLLSTAPSHAACYTPVQFRAEQALRFHTKLMVGGMLCQGLLRQNTYADYQRFTTRNQNIIRDQENNLIGFFRQSKNPRPEIALHALRTDLANLYAVRASASIRNFCNAYKNDWQQAKTMQPNNFTAWIASLMPTPKADTYRPVCSR